MELDAVSFGHWLRLKRKALDLTRERLADQVGCSVATIRKLEAEERRPSAQIAGRLAEIFKIPPNEQATFLRFARGDLKSAPPGNDITVPWRVQASRTNLPASLTSFIGREQQLKDIHAYLLNNEIRLVSLIGPPGIGKTRLSLETARTLFASFSDGVFFVALAPIDDPSLIASAILQALGYQESKNLPAIQQLKDGISSKRILMVVDNCEHLIEEVTSLVSEFLSACPNLKILTTSRESLRLPGEWVYPVPALATPETGLTSVTDTAVNYPALVLFTERARAVRPEFTLNSDNIAAVSAICAKVDGLPLAIELIAARIRSMSPQALLDQIKDQFFLSAESARADSLRHKTLENAIAWSHNLLPEEEKELFIFLSVFTGGWSLEAAERVYAHVDAASSGMLDLLTHLVDKSLIRVDQTKSGQTRYDMLDTVRQFASRKLLEGGKSKLARNSHLDFFLKLAEEADPKLRGPDEMFWFEELDREQANLHAALSWALESRNGEAGLRLAGNLTFFWFVHSHTTEGITFLEKLLAQSQGAPENLRALNMRWLGSMLFWKEGGKNGRAASLLEESLAIYRNSGNKAGIAWVLNLQAINAYFRGEYKKAIQLLGESLALRKELGDPWAIAHTLQNYAPIEMDQGDYASAEKHANETLDWFQRAGDDRGVARTLNDLGNLARKKGDYQQAAAILAKSLSKLWQVRDRWSVAFVLENLASLASAQGNYEKAIRLFGAAETLREAIGLPLPASDLRAHEDDLTTIRKHLAGDIVNKLWEEGKELTIEQAVEFAIHEG